MFQDDMHLYCWANSSMFSQCCQKVPSIAHDHSALVLIDSCMALIWQSKIAEKIVAYEEGKQVFSRSNRTLTSRSYF